MGDITIRTVEGVQPSMDLRKRAAQLAIAVLTMRFLAGHVVNMGGTLFNAQLTDGGPPPAQELPNRSAGPTFGEAPGSVFRRSAQYSAEATVCEG